MSWQFLIKKSIVWTSFSQISRQILYLISTIIFARLLSPTDFGLLGMSMVAINLFMLIKDLGTSSAIIQTKTVTTEFLSSIYWFNFVLGFLMAALLFFFAPAISLIYHEPRLTYILKILSLVFILFGLSSVRQAVLERELNFEILAKIELISVCFGVAVGVTMAYQGMGAISLVYQYMVMIVMTTLLLVCFSSWKPKKYFRTTDIISIAHFSSHLSGFNLTNFLIRNFDSFLIGKFCGAQNLGFYTMAYQILLLPIQNISNIMTRVFFPFYSKIQDDNKNFRKIYLKMSFAVALITFPMVIGLFIVVNPFTLGILGIQWKPIVMLLMILAPVALIQCLGGLVGVIYQAKGKTDWMFFWSIFASFFVIFGFLIGIHWSILGIAISYLITSLLLTYLNFLIPFHLINLKIGDFYNHIKPIFISAMKMFLILLIVKWALPSVLSNKIQCAILMFIGISSYLIIIWFSHRNFVIELINIIRSRN